MVRIPPVTDTIQDFTRRGIKVVEDLPHNVQRGDSGIIPKTIKTAEEKGKDYFITKAMYMGLIQKYLV